MLTTEIDRLDQFAGIRFGLNRTDLRCLDVLNTQGPLTASELAHAVRLSSGGLSIALRRLEGSGLITRRTDNVDRRLVKVTSTPKAQALEQAVFGQLEQTTKALIGRRTKVELQIILAFLSELRGGFRSAIGDGAS